MFNLDNFLAQNKWRLDAKALDSFYFPRECINQVINKATDSNPLILKGPHGAGKTTILHILVKHLITELSIPPENIFYFNLDDPLSCNFFRGSDDVLNFIKGFVPKNDKQIYLILDEIQHLITSVSDPLALIQEIAGKFAGKLIITSSRVDFTPALKELSQIEIHTFGFKDYLNRMLNPQNIYLPELKENSAEYLTRVMTNDYSKLILPYLDDYLIYGGYPLVVRKFNPEEKPELLRQVYAAGFEELLAFGGKINQPERFTKLIQMLAQSNGELQKVLVLAKECGLSRATVEHYRDILADNYIVSAVYPGGDGSRSGVPMIYFNDTGLRNCLISLFHKPETRIDRDNLLNNFLYRNLVMLDGKINYLRIGRTNRIIFNFKRAEMVILATVLYDYPQRKSGYRGLASLAGRMKPQKAIIITRDYFQYEKIGNTAFICLPVAMAWLLPEIVNTDFK